MPENLWRKELWHPVTVHFPIALLLVATLFLLVSFFASGNFKITLRNGSVILLIIGSVGAWIGIYTGDLADGIVARKLCDPTMLKAHENAAKTSTWLFTIAAIIQVLLSLDFFKISVRNVLRYLVFILALVASVYLINAGHLGAKLVYQQGAGVDNHTVNCDE